MWYHAECQKLTTQELALLQKIPQDYLCLSCVKHGDEFDYIKLLYRLQMANNGDMLEKAVKLEEIFLRDTPVFPTRIQEPMISEGRVDMVALNIIRKYGTGKCIENIIINNCYLIFRSTFARMKGFCSKRQLFFTLLTVHHLFTFGLYFTLLV